MCPANYWWSAKRVTIFVWCDNCGISEAVRRNECMEKVENYANSIVRIMNFLQLFFLQALIKKHFRFSALMTNKMWGLF